MALKIPCFLLDSEKNRASWLSPLSSPLSQVQTSSRFFFSGPHKLSMSTDMIQLVSEFEVFLLAFPFSSEHALFFGSYLSSAEETVCS